MDVCVKLAAYARMQINSRKIFNELNPFSGVLTNGIFMGVLSISAVIQFITVQVLWVGLPHWL